MTVEVGITPFRPEPLPQHSASSFWKVDCVPTASALSVNRCTVDALRPSPWNIRQAAGVTEYRGMSYGEAVMGVVTWTGKKGRRVTPIARYGVTRPDAKAFVDGGSSTVFSIHTLITAGGLRATNEYVGPHSVSAHDYRWCTAAADCRCELKGKPGASVDHGEYLIEDPGTTTAGWRWWSSALLYKAGEFRTGGNGINCIVFPDTEIVVWKATRASEIRSEPSYQLGKRLTLAVEGRTYKGGRTENGDEWARDDATRGRGWVHVVYSGTTPSTYKWGWAPGRFGAQAA